MNPYYERDGIVLYHADCRNLLATLETGSVDAVVTSPPYNCGMEYGEHDDVMGMLEYWAFIEEAYSAAANLAKPGGFACWNVPNWIGSRESRVFALDEYRPIFDRHLGFTDWIIWDKSPARGAAWGNYPSSPRIRAEHENILIHRACGEAIGDSDISWEDWSRYTTSIWKIPPTLPYGDKHPATFPEEIPHRLISLYSIPSGTILDPFAGSCTTGVAAWNLGRKAILCEISEEYCELGAKRLDRVISQGRLFKPQPVSVVQKEMFGE